ncbi:hypothetical protein RJ639_045451 [Escallonia herrerae]|uniref:Calcineurin-like phosphoesterase domain-containing protein n=1 Tax=Escallonia herrerae TaxID=1293975 RepID=A0AA88W733_9ASTE|nr:hypothetical protein RJ639_045451 [Escallonia herrerae]
MGAAIWVLFLCLIVPSSTTGKREIIDVKGGPDDVVWVVQLSDLHFSVHHPERAGDFKRLVGPTLSMINPSLVLVTGDLTGAAESKGTPMSPSSHHNQINSVVVSARARYSDSVLKRETMNCFLLHQEMRELPRTKQKPIVERQLKRSRPQSASKKAVSCREDADG